MRFLLDTNIVSGSIRNPGGRITECVARVGEACVCRSVIVAAELRHGAAKKGFRRLSTQLTKVLGAIDVVAFEPPADARHGDLRARLESKGRVIGPNDLLIAAQALALDHVLVTDNEEEFSRVEGLTLENWFRD